jgi:undecaprenyl-diphosphatase
MRMLLPVALGGLALYLLLPKVAHSGRAVAAMRGGHWSWLALTAAAALGTYVMAAIALIAAAQPPLHLGCTLVVQLAAAFTNRLSPAGLGGMATNIRYVERSGAQRSSAVATVALISLAGFIVHLGAITAVVPLLGAAGPALPTPDTPDHASLLIIIVALALVVSAALAWKRRLWAKAMTPGRAAGARLLAILHAPKRAVALFLGCAGVTVCYIVALAACLHAFGATLPLVRVCAVYLGASAVASVAPTPGGLGPLEAALVAGLSSAGAPAGPAVAAVIAYRLITYWLPVVPGALAFLALRKRGLV